MQVDRNWRLLLLMLTVCRCHGPSRRLLFSLSLLDGRIAVVVPYRCVRCGNARRQGTLCRRALGHSLAVPPFVVRKFFRWMTNATATATATTTIHITVDICGARCRLWKRNWWEVQWFVAFRGGS